MIFKPKVTQFANSIQMEKQVDAPLRFEVTSIAVVIDAPVEVVWELMGCSAIHDWCPFARVQTLLEQRGTPPPQIFSEQFLAMQKNKLRNEGSSFATDPPKILPLRELQLGESDYRRFEYELPRTAKGIKCRATSDHRVWRVAEDEYERTKYELCEKFYASKMPWDRSLNPGIMETSTREFAKKFKRVCEEEAARRQES